VSKNRPYLRRLQAVIEVLRMPHAPNAVYHEDCYTWDHKEIVVRVLQLREKQPCTACGAMVSGKPAVKVEQLGLWDAA
jgi:hypothetical protein